MAEAKHTPGPWRVEATKGWGGDLCILADGPKPIFKAIKPDAYYTDYAPGSSPGSVILSDETAAKRGRYVATKEIKDELDAIEAANAHLIAAAPDMQEAIIEADGCFEAALAEGWLDALAAGDIDRIRELWDRRISHARNLFPAAIAKAEGRS